MRDWRTFARASSFGLLKAYSYCWIAGLRIAWKPLEGASVDVANTSLRNTFILIILITRFKMNKLFFNMIRMQFILNIFIQWVSSRPVWMLTKLQIENLYKVQFPNNYIQAKPLKSNDLRIISIGITSRSLNDQKIWAWELRSISKSEVYDFSESSASIFTNLSKLALRLIDSMELYKLPYFMQFVVWIKTIKPIVEASIEKFFKRNEHLRT